eukprot:scaffold4815_cov363-Prasinococcus_capsulatus_cf.AAC.2
MRRVGRTLVCWSGLYLTGPATGCREHCSWKRASGVLKWSRSLGARSIARSARLRGVRGAAPAPAAFPVCRASTARVRGSQSALCTTGRTAARPCCPSAAPHAGEWTDGRTDGRMDGCMAE